jgi:hypothetical protein
LWVGFAGTSGLMWLTGREPETGAVPAVAAARSTGSWGSTRKRNVQPPTLRMIGGGLSACAGRRHALDA